MELSIASKSAATSFSSAGVSSAAARGMARAEEGRDWARDLSEPFDFTAQPLEDGLAEHTLRLRRVAVPEKEQLRRPGQCDLWAFVWTATSVMADLVASLDLRGCHVLELGAGVGVPSLVAAQHGADKVVATDLVGEALELIARNAAENRLEAAVHTARLDWSAFELPASELVASAAAAPADRCRPTTPQEPPLEPGRVDLLLGSDVLYLRRWARPLARLTAHFLRPEGGVALFVDPGRAGSEELASVADEYGLRTWTCSVDFLRTPVALMRRCTVYLVWTPTPAERANPSPVFATAEEAPEGLGFRPSADEHPLVARLQCLVGERLLGRKETGPIAREHLGFRMPAAPRPEDSSASEGVGEPRDG